MRFNRWNPAIGDALLRLGDLQCDRAAFSDAIRSWRDALRLLQSRNARTPSTLLRLSLAHTFRAELAARTDALARLESEHSDTVISWQGGLQSVGTVLTSIADRDRALLREHSSSWTSRFRERSADARPTAELSRPSTRVGT